MIFEAFGKKDNLYTGRVLLAAAAGALLLCVAACPAFAIEDLPLTPETVPDENLRQILAEDDEDANGILSGEELRGLTYFTAYGAGIEDVTGMEHLVFLRDIYMPDNDIKNADFSALTKLENLTLRANPVETLVMPASLTVLDVSDCGLTALDVSNLPDLDQLDADGNKLTALDVSSNLELTTLNCSDNKLTTLDVSKNLELKRLICYANKLTAVDVTNNANLQNLYCDNNDLTEIDVSANPELEVFSCGNNKLQTLDVSANPELTNLSCSQNKLEALDVTVNTQLESLWCYGNNFDTLDLSTCKKLNKNNSGAPTDCKVTYASFGGIDWLNTWEGIRVLLFVVAFLGAIVWLVQYCVRKARKQ